MIQKKLLEQLRQVDKRVARKYPESYGLDQIGLILCKPTEAEQYWCTPQNSRVFARTGGDGVHFSLLLLPGESDVYEGPVVMSRPSNSGALNLIVGANLYEFLCLGSRCSYDQLAYLDEAGFDANESVYDILMADGDAWESAEECAAHAKQTSEILQLVNEDLGLKPWEDVPGKLKDLQTRYLDSLELSCEE